MALHGRIAVTANHAMLVVGVEEGAVVRTIGGRIEGGGDGQFNGPCGVAALGGGRLAVVDRW